MKVLVVLGTRPEAVKLAPVIQEMQARSQRDGLQTVVCSTAQHREMLDQVLRIFDIHPHYDMDVMAKNQTPTQVAAAVLRGMEEILGREKPDWVVVQGDTTTVAATAWAAFYARARVAHVEAGLRTFDKWQPFPEEINRRLAAVTTDLHFAPTQTARRNLLTEGIPDRDILVTGNPVIDAIRQVAALPLTDTSSPLPDRLLDGRRVVLVTAHRRENLGAPLEDVCAALLELARRYGNGVQIVYPVHLNPRVQETAYRLLSGVPNVTLTEPLDYLSLVRVLRRAFLVLTDSGGLQEEAPSLGVPVLVLRNVTERPEAVEAGTVRLVGTDRDRILREASRLFDDAAAYAAMARAVNPYGDGWASQRIVAALLGERVEPFSPAARQESAVASGLS
jgi:UDP-N-acetylglucosamine 2-epimerase (non-hydrolysing)